MRRASRILDEDGRARRAVELRIGGWLQGEPRSGDGSLVVRSHAALVAVSYRPVEGDG
jgi:hypothetical protein